MNTRPSLYRSTLIAAAVAIGCFGAAAAQAHDQGWRGHGDEHGWHSHDRGWRDHDRGWRDHDRDGYRGWAPRYGYAGPIYREGWYGYAPPPAYYPAPPAAYYPAPVVYGPGGVSVVVRLPF